MTITEEWLISRGGGRLQSIRDTGIQSNGSAALEIALRECLLGDDLNVQADKGGENLDIAEVRTVFSRMFPQGIVYDPRHPIPPLFDSLPSIEKRIILANNRSTIVEIQEEDDRRDEIGECGRNQYEINGPWYTGDDCYRGE